MAAKAVVRDVGRVLGIRYGFVDRIAKLIPFELGITLERGAREGAGAAPAQYREQEDVQASSIWRARWKASRAMPASMPVAW